MRKMRLLLLAAGAAQGASTSSCPTIEVTYYDFNITHPDMEPVKKGLTCGTNQHTAHMVEDQLGADRKPVCNAAAECSMMHSCASFQSWFSVSPFLQAAREKPVKCLLTSISRT